MRRLAQAVLDNDPNISENMNDLVMKAIKHKTMDLVQRDKTVGEIARDEFHVLLPLCRILLRLEEVFTRMTRMGEFVISFSVSVGVCLHVAERCPNLSCFFPQTISANMFWMMTRAQWT